MAQTITFTVNKANVYNEVAKTTSYAGKKLMDADEQAYKRIFATDEDEEMLESFWLEACNAVTDEMKPFLNTVSQLQESHGVDLAENFVLTLDLSSAFDTTLTQSINTSLFRFFVAYIVSKWFRLSNKPEAESYGADATAMMEDVSKKVWYRKKPTRVIPV